ncbi:MAG: dihydroorotate dehydrogenase-like protein [Bacteriovoracaceae bacterium]|nr:dihydroorotate dehydrogenase-like protein [Bacteriovoracaceae bacterium]
MISTKCTFAGLELDSPVILSASPISSNPQNIIRAQEFGAGAVILRSLFEEQITDGAYDEQSTHPEMADYIIQSKAMEYLNHIAECKKVSTLPIIASINCHSSNNWTDFAKSIEAAGANAIELNIMTLPEKKKGTEGNKVTTSSEIESELFDIAVGVKNAVDIPVVVKLSPYLTSVYDVAYRLSYLGMDGITLFNRFFTPEIDLETMEINAKMNYSTPGSIHHGLRWTSILFDEVNTDLSASTGIYTADDALKMILAGSTTVQLCSAIYTDGLKAISEINEGIHKWMIHHNYKRLEDFRGKLSVKNNEGSKFTRTQFIEHLGTHKN